MSGNSKLVPMAVSGTDKQINDAKVFELIQASLQMRVKYIYFLLAAAGASIGFSMTQTKEAMLSVYLLPWAAAQLCWGISFYLGCVAVRSFSESTLTNADVINSPITSMFGETVVFSQLSNREDKVRVFNQHISRALIAYDRQLKALLIGAAFFISWHIIEMWRRTPENMCLWV
ncbi:hypothetical protein [Alcaligenes aquatilis]|uniref:hypothetical protein n=1 Tax=Alcaligenes aquatilis TaxID=323284 RepID=UPI003F92ECA7